MSNKTVTAPAISRQNRLGALVDNEVDTMKTGNTGMKDWSLSHRTLVAMALGCGTLMLGAGPAAYAMGQDGNAPAVSQESRTDAQIQGDVEKKLAAPGISGQKITASTSNGVVTLNGSVTDEVTRQLAENAASGVAGVKSVQNNLAVGDLPPADAAPAADQNAQTPPADNGQSAAAQQGGSASSNNGWGPAGPPPDAVNGQIPPRPADDQAPQGAPAPTNGQAPQPQAGTSYGAPPNPYPVYPGYPTGQYPNGQAPIRPPYQGYQQAPPPPRPQYVQPKGPVTIPAGALVTVRLQNPIDARRTKDGDMFVVNVSRDVFQDGVLALPIGATLEGRIVAVKKPGAFAGGGYIQLQLTQLDLDGHSYPLTSDIYSTVTPGKGGYSAANTIGGAAFGAILGAAVGGGPGAAIGAVAGGGTGAAISSATPAPRTFIPGETMITFHLSTPLTVQPVSYQEATRLAATVQNRPVVLQPRRPYYMAPPGYYPGPY